MRILAIESSTPLGSVALWEAGRIVYEAEHAELNAHAERLLPLLEQAMGAAGWSLTSLDRLAVAIGPGSFTGLRVGIALAQGIALGASLPIVGIGSLAAMAHGSTSVPAARCPILDARRNEVFLAVYAANGGERVAPCSLAKEKLADWLRENTSRYELTPIGDIALKPAGIELWHDAPSAPHARSVAALAAGAQVNDNGNVHAVAVHYVRLPDLVVPNLPPSPFGDQGSGGPGPV